jgi:tetratricopeptide (TPR) repeat protein
MNECKQFQADLTDYARGEYKYIKDFDALFNHLRECEECREKFFDLEALFKELRPPYEPSPQFLKRMEELKEMFKKGPPPTREPENPSTRELHRGIDLYKKQKWFEAAKVFDELVKKEPNNANAYYHRGLAHQRMNLLTEAVADFTKAIDLDNEAEQSAVPTGRQGVPTGVGDADAYFHRAQIYYNNLEWDKAIPDLNHAINLNPDYSEAYYGLGMIDNQIGEWEKAIDDFSAVIEREPENALAYFHRGVNRTLNKSNKSAREDFKKAMELVPDEPATYLNIGITYAIEGNLKEAMNWFNQSLKVNPKYQEAKDVIKMAQEQMKAEKLSSRVNELKGSRVAKKGKQSRKISVVDKYKVRVKELEVENKTLKETQKQLLALIAKQQPNYANQLQGKTLPQEFSGLNAFLKIPTEGQAVSPKNIRFSLKS